MKDPTDSAMHTLAFLTAAALADLGESVRGWGRLIVEGDGHAISVKRPDGSRIITVPIERLFDFDRSNAVS